MLTPLKWLEDTELQANLFFTNWVFEIHGIVSKI